MVKIGTRAIISIDGKPMLTTHWDGYPASLGRDLLRCDKLIEAVVEVAEAHTVDAADPQVIETLNRQRINQLAEKHRLTVNAVHLRRIWFSTPSPRRKPGSRRG